MTKLSFKTHADPVDYTADLHILTFAEQGFAPLDLHGRRLGVTLGTLSAFTEAVNQAEDTGTLFSAAPITALPRECVRDTTEVEPVVHHLQEFLKANEASLHATRLLLDFSTPRLPKHVLEAILQVFDAGALSGIAEVMVIRN